MQNIEPNAPVPEIVHARENITTAPNVGNLPEQLQSIFTSFLSQITSSFRPIQNENTVGGNPPMEVPVNDVPEGSQNLDDPIAQRSNENVQSVGPTPKKISQKSSKKSFVATREYPQVVAPRD